MQTIRAALLRDFGAPLTIEEVILRRPRAGEVQVAIEAVAICASDIGYLDGGFRSALPVVLGHEAAGRITALGPGVHGLAAGQRVLVSLLRACGTCPSCASGHPAICEAPRPDDASPLTLPDGTPVAQGLDVGAFAEAVVVGAEQVAPVPETMPMDAASLLACGVITGVGSAVNVARIRPGESVVVIGAGGVGLNAIQGARLAGARQIIAVDLSAEKLDTAVAFGATHGVIATGEKPWAEVRVLTGGRGAAVVMVAVGLAPVYESAPRYLAPGGRMVMVGLPHASERASYSPLGMAYAGQSILGSMMGDTVLARDIPWLVGLYGQGRLKLDELISGRWSLDEINAAIASTRSGAARRNVVVFGHG
jgi:Zn-dependent alcohol dehydrogenase